MVDDSVDDDVRDVRAHLVGAFVLAGLMTPADPPGITRAQS
jgi:hypothetical protein